MTITIDPGVRPAPLTDAERIAALERQVADLKEQIAAAQPALEPCAMRYDYDGYGYKYIDAGSGSDWRTRLKDAEPLYAEPPQRKPLTEPVARKPLTKEEMRTIARVIEAAHRIMED